MDGWKRTRHLDWAMISLSTLREKGVTVKEKHVGDFHRKKKPARENIQMFIWDERRHYDHQSGSGRWVSRTYTNRSIQTISGYTFSFCFIFVSPIFYFMGAVSGRIEGYGEKEITKVVSHMFLLRLPSTFQHIATEEKKRDPDPNSFFFSPSFFNYKNDVAWKLTNEKKTNSRNNKYSTSKKQLLEKQTIRVNIIVFSIAKSIGVRQVFILFKVTFTTL